MANDTKIPICQTFLDRAVVVGVPHKTAINFVNKINPKTFAAIRAKIRHCISQT